MAQPQDEYKVTEKEIEENGLQGVSGNTLPNNSATENKLRFDKLPTLIANKLNDSLDYLQSYIDTCKTELTEADENNVQSLQDSLNEAVTSLNQIISANYTSNRNLANEALDTANEISEMVDNGEISTASITYGTAEPTGGKDGDIYIQISEV